jgi:hypothetical protein
MGRISIRCQVLIGFVAISSSSGSPTRAAAEVHASKSLTVQASGPRQGSAGSNYFNVQGKTKERFAGFGVLVFQVPSGENPAEIKDLTITLVQSIPAFASDGKLKFYLAQLSEADSGSLQKLKFDPQATGGLAVNAFKSLHLLGSGAFKKVETGRVDNFLLKPDEMARNELRKTIKAGGLIHVVVVPDDDDVAATYFGAGNETVTNRPRIKMGE